MSSRRFIRPITVLLMMWLPACYSWQGTRVSDIPRDTVRLRVRMLDERRLEVATDRVTADSIFGRGRPLLLRHGDWFPGGEWRPVSLAFADVKRAEKLAVSGSQTAFAGVFGMLVIGLTAGLIALSTWDGPLGNCCR